MSHIGAFQNRLWLGKSFLHARIKLNSSSAARVKGEWGDHKHTLSTWERLDESCTHNEKLHKKLREIFQYFFCLAYTLSVSFNDNSLTCRYQIKISQRSELIGVPWSNLNWVVIQHQTTRAYCICCVVVRCVSQQFCQHDVRFFRTSCAQIDWF